MNWPDFFFKVLSFHPDALVIFIVGLIALVYFVTITLIHIRDIRKKLGLINGIAGDSTVVTKLDLKLAFADFEKVLDAKFVSKAEFGAHEKLSLIQDENLKVRFEMLEKELMEQRHREHSE